MADRRLTPHGELLDSARVTLGITQREAARRAEISEARWRQIVTGVQRQGGVDIPVNPKPATLVRMARAVDADLGRVFAAAGLTLQEDIRRDAESERPTLEERVAALERLIAELVHGPAPQPARNDEKDVRSGETA